MEALVSRVPDAAFWEEQRVFLTGHTGFKGSWMTAWLRKMGAKVFGYALSPITEPALFDVLKVSELADGKIADICDFDNLNAAMSAFSPTVVFHMAAQPLVRLSYDEPIETFRTNVLGTANVLEAARRIPSVRSIVSITTDKCYENKEQIWPYRETDRLGGKDPYSASKACAELVSAAYHWSFLSKMAECGAATVRAGNVIGGGDWSKDRLIPDMAKAFAVGAPGLVRRPDGIRPWQHVMEPLAGYLLAAEAIYGKTSAEPLSWNFGPESDGNITVGEVVQIFASKWPGASVEVRPDPNAVHEATLLALDSSKAKKELSWQPRFTVSQALALTADWYRAYYTGADVTALTYSQIDQYINGIG